MCIFTTSGIISAIYKDEKRYEFVRSLPKVWNSRHVIEDAALGGRKWQLT